GGLGGYAGAGRGPKGGPGGISGRGAPGAGPGGGDGSTTLIKPKPLSSLRLVIVTSDNKRTEALLHLDTASILRDDWSSIAIPLAALAQLKQSSEVMTELQLFGDSPVTIYLLQSGVLHDDMQVRV